MKKFREYSSCIDLEIFLRDIQRIKILTVDQSEVMEVAYVR